MTEYFAFVCHDKSILFGSHIFIMSHCSKFLLNLVVFQTGGGDNGLPDVRYGERPVPDPKQGIQTFPDGLSAFIHSDF